MVKVTELRTEYFKNPLGVDIPAPRLSWKIESKGKNIFQTEFNIRCALSPLNLKSGENLLWNTGNVKSGQSVHVEYQGEKPVSGQRIWWQVKIKVNSGGESGWSEPAYWETGLLQKSDWQARWIEPAPEGNPEISNPCPFLRKEFEIQKKIKKAAAYITCHGLYQLRLNGSKAGDQELTPGWTSYEKRLQYQVYDITGQVQPGKNTIGIILGDGWYRGFLGWEGKRNLYGSNVALLFQLKLTFADGSEENIISDKSWKTSIGPILSSEIYHGEIYDARLEKTGWDLPGFDDSRWEPVFEKDYGFENLVASAGPPVKVISEIKPVAKIITPKGETVFDFGQNMVGRIRFCLKGYPGEKIRISHAEVLDKNGNFYTGNLRLARQEIDYTFKSNNIEFFEPHFTYMGFRYIKTEGYPGETGTDNFTGQVIHSDMEFTGNFECSEPLVNRLHKNIRWGLRGNFVDIPTDCPQRNERMGWTGDAQVFTPTASFYANVAPFFSKWMKDLAADQRGDGSVPWVVPMKIENGGGTGWSDGYGATGWADAAIIIPWIVYLRFGDKRILEEQYSSMKAWEEYMIKEAGSQYLFNTGFHFGDWLSFAEYSSYIYDAPDYGYAGAQTDKDLIATAYFYYSTTLMGQIARITGKTDDALKYAKLAPKIKAAFGNEFISPNGRLASNTQTAYALALSFGLFPDKFVKTASERLAADVNHFQHITTGFLGTPLLNETLTDFGYPELAYKLLFNTRYPSWLYPVTMGATTIWERWDGIKPDNSFQDEGMNSFNHYAYGAVGNWLFSRVAGIRPLPENPGFKKFIIQPVLTEKLTYAGATFESMYGKIESRWETKGNRVYLSVAVPANSSAIIFIPSAGDSNVTENSVPVGQVEGIEVKGLENGYTIVEAGSGHYRFEAIYK